MSDDLKDLPDDVRVKRPYNKKPPVGTPTKKEWSDVARMVYDNSIELLQDRDDAGRLTCTPSLLTAVQKLIIESETLVQVEKTSEVNTLNKQLKKKRQNRKLKIVDHDIESLSGSNDLGYPQERQGTKMLHLRDNETGED